MARPPNLHCVDAWLSMDHRRWNDKKPRPLHTAGRREAPGGLR
jgi:hypothetical protein